MFTGLDILRRAVAILEKGPPTAEQSAHGPWCVWCAIAIAKGELDREQETGVTISELMEDLALGYRERDSDWPLVHAKIALGRYSTSDAEQPVNQNEAITKLWQAQVHLQAPSTASSSAE